MGGSGGGGGRGGAGGGGGGSGSSGGGSAGGEARVAVGNVSGQNGPQIIEWEEADRYSFEDSDRFEEDSLCSWSSEPESLCNNWRGWRRPTTGFTTIKKPTEGESLFTF